MPDVKRRIAMVKARFGKLRRHLWNDNCLHLNLKLRLYKSSVYSILTYGSEAWYLTAEVARSLNGANAQMHDVFDNEQDAASRSRDEVANL